MSKKNTASTEAVKEEDIEVITAAGVLYFKTHAELIQKTTANWMQLADAMDAALVIKSKDPSLEDEADAAIVGAASGLFKDISTLVAFFGDTLDVSIESLLPKEEEFDFVPF